MRHAALLVVLLSGCGPPWGQWMRAKSPAPFKLGSVESALWLEASYSDTSHGQGRATLLLIDTPVSCADYQEDDFHDELFRASGIELSVSWRHRPFGDSGDASDVGWEGVYFMGANVDALEDDGVTTRYFYGLAFADGTVYDLEAGAGETELRGQSSELVWGQVDAPLFAARFRAENCGQESLEQDTG